MQEGIAPKIVNLALDAKYGKFAIEPLARGFGDTLGTALRRVLMAHIEGAAITDVRFDGALHEFSALDGVVEDSTELLLNIKELAIKLHPSAVLATEGEDEHMLRIDMRGPGMVSGSDVTATAGLEILNPELHIAELSNDTARLYVEMWVERGVGFMPVEHPDRRRRGPGIIPLDAVYSPITRTSYHVEPTRLGHRTDLERLVLEIWGDGTSMPDAALRRAAEILTEYLSIFVSIATEELPAEEAEAAPVEARNKVLDMPIEEVDFSVRTFNCLKKEGINTLGQLTSKTEEDLLDIRNFGHRSLDEVLEKLTNFGLSLAVSPDHA
jgi:DNA-directed RNA polymerase subunit alpha